MTAPDRPITDAEAPLHEGTLVVSWSMDDKMITVRPQYDCPCPELILTYSDLMELNAEVLEELSSIEGVTEDGTSADTGIESADEHELACIYIMLRHSPVDATIAQMIGESLSGLTAFDGLVVVIEEDDRSGKYFPPAEQWPE